MPHFQNLQVNEDVKLLKSKTKSDYSIYEEENKPELSDVQKEMRDKNITYESLKRHSYQLIENKQQERRICEVEKDMITRNKRIEEICRKYDIKDSLFKGIQDPGKSKCNESCPIFWVPRKKFMYCSIPKVGCSTLRSNVWEVVKPGVPTHGELHDLINVDLTRVSPNYLNETTRSKMIKFIFVRHPIDRLISAFKSKAESEGNRKIIFGHYLLDLMKRLRKDENVTAATKPFFREFVTYLLESSPKTYDQHWQLFWDRCAPCTVKYDFIGKMETFARDKQYIFEKIGVKVGEEWINKWESSKSYEEYLSQITKEELLKLKTIFAFDFLLFDYSIEPFLKYVKN